MIEVEVLILFVSCIVLSILYEIENDDLFVCGILATFLWIIFGLYYFVSGVEFPIIALVFHGIGFLYLIRIIVQWYRRIQQERYGLEDEEEFGL